MSEEELMALAAYLNRVADEGGAIIGERLKEAAQAITELRDQRDALIEAFFEATMIIGKASGMTREQTAEAILSKIGAKS